MKIKIVLDVPEANGLEGWLEDAIRMWGRTVSESSSVVSIGIIYNQEEQQINLAHQQTVAWQEIREMQDKEIEGALKIASEKKGWIKVAEGSYEKHEE